MRKIGTRSQRTISQPAKVQGVGFLTGAEVCVRFVPAPPNTGIVLVRKDLPKSPAVAAHIKNVTGTNRRTTLGRPPAQVELVEHVLAALAGLRIDNCYVELNAPEPPGLDGSAHGFVQALRAAGMEIQNGQREIWATETAVTVVDQHATLTLHPGCPDKLRISYLLDYGPGSAIDLQRHTQDLGSEEFLNGVHDCRTFLLQEEADYLRKQGLGSRTTAADLLIFGQRGPIDNRLRFANEPARHKVLDLVGDLSLLGHDLRGHVVAYRSGHSLNAELVRRLTELMSEGRRPMQKIAA